MIIILKRITENVRVSDIEDFLEPALKGGWFKTAGRIEGISIKSYQQRGVNKVEYHAFAEIEPDKAALRAIKILNHKPLKGKLISVSEFKLRHFSNDRRQNRYQILNNRRVADRRRKNLIIRDITAHSAYAEDKDDFDWN
jgi:RNA recognition motif-containing protein